ncbi:MAG: sensor histidine kinase, partial [Microvirga sp.]
GVSNASSTSTGTPVKISASHPSGQAVDEPAADARLYTILWDHDSALALIFSETREQGAAMAAAIANAVPVAEPSPVGHADAEELGAILDTAAEGIVMFDGEGNINSCNRSAEALFGYDSADLAQRNLAELFAPESQHAVFDYLASIKRAGVESLLDHGREALGRVRQGGFVPLSITMGRTRAGGPNFFAVFRDLSQARKSESELREARRLADRAATAKADMLARISHEVRTPLNAIIGFAEVMLEERFGPIGNERYKDYLRDIHASGGHVISLVNDLLDLAKVEAGRLELAFTSVNLNELVANGVTLMQPQAARERIVMRSSLAQKLPAVVADERSVTQIILNVVANAIRYTEAGGQVIVSTAVTERGEVVIRVRDTGLGMTPEEVEAAMQPFRQLATSRRGGGTGLGLPLTKALVEANRGALKITSARDEGTLVEVLFPPTRVLAD